MTVLKMLLLLLHAAGFLGILAMIGTQLRKSPARIPGGTLHSALTALVSGLGLVAVNAWGLDLDINVVKIATKFSVLVVIIVLVVREQKRPATSKGMLLGLGALTLLNIAIAVAV